MNWNGEALWLKIGSVRIISPSISTRTVAWPIQVTLRPGPESERFGFWTKYGSITGSSLSRACRDGNEEGPRRETEDRVKEKRERKTQQKKWEKRKTILFWITECFSLMTFQKWTIIPSNSENRVTVFYPLQMLQCCTQKWTCLCCCFQDLSSRQDHKDFQQTWESASIWRTTPTLQALFCQQLSFMCVAYKTPTWHAKYFKYVASFLSIKLLCMLLHFSILTGFTQQNTVHSRG